MLVPATFVALAFVLTAEAAAAQPASPAPPTKLLDLPSGRADRIIVSFPSAAAPPAAPMPGAPPMLLRLDGIAAVLRGPEELRRLTASLAAAERSDAAAYTSEVPGALRRWTLTCDRAGSTDHKQVDILQTAAGGLVAHEIDPGGRPTPLLELRSDRFGELSAPWMPYEAAFDAAAVADPRGSIIQLPPPLLVGRFTLDKATISDRFAHGLSTNLKPADRAPATESLFARLPASYDPRTPAGLLVWVDAGPDGRPPDPLFKALDELNMVAIGAANSGNNRPAVDREQLALDAVATASARWHIDPRRVYVTGISGGGRISSMLAACFPDVFTGAVPIVGLSVYTKVQLPAPAIGQFVRAGYERPSAPRFALFRQHRIAPITGPKDMNFGEISEAVKILARDGIPTKLFSYDDMAHELPTPDRFLEALRWVDEPWQDARRKETEQAQRLLDAYTTQYTDRPPPDAAARKALTKITDLAPYSAPAWKAADLLRTPTSRPSTSETPR